MLILLKNINIKIKCKINYLSKSIYIYNYDILTYQSKNKI